MENGPFIVDFPIKTSIYRGFSMAMLNNQMVIGHVSYHQFLLVIWKILNLLYNFSYLGNHPNWRTHICQRGLFNQIHSLLQTGSCFGFTMIYLPSNQRSKSSTFVLRACHLGPSCTRLRVRNTSTKKGVDRDWGDHFCMLSRGWRQSMEFFVPSGHFLHNYGKIHNFFTGKLTIDSHFQ